MKPTSASLTACWMGSVVEPSKVMLLMMVRMITPRLYAWKGAKWIRKVEFLTEEQLGFWELRGYSNRARPWANDRFSG